WDDPLRRNRRSAPQGIGSNRERGRAPHGTGSRGRDRRRLARRPGIRIVSGREGALARGSSNRDVGAGRRTGERISRRTGRGRDDRNERSAFSREPGPSHAFARGSMSRAEGATAPASLPVIAIDGAAATGKTTTASRVAAALGFCYVDSGAIYRAVAFGLRELGVIEGEELDEAR